MDAETQAPVLVYLDRNGLALKVGDNVSCSMLQISGKLPATTIFRLDAFRLGTLSQTEAFIESTASEIGSRKIRAWVFTKEMVFVEPEPAGGVAGLGAVEGGPGATGGGGGAATNAPTPAFPTLNEVVVGGEGVADTTLRRVPAAAHIPVPADHSTPAGIWGNMHQKVRRSHSCCALPKSYLQQPAPFSLPSPSLPRHELQAKDLASAVQNSPAVQQSFPNIAGSDKTAILAVVALDAKTCTPLPFLRIVTPHTTAHVSGISNAEAFLRSPGFPMAMTSSAVDDHSYHADGPSSRAHWARAGEHVVGMFDAYHMQKDSQYFFASP